MESVREFIAGIGNTDFKHIWLKLYLTFIRNGLKSQNAKIKYLSERHYLSKIKLNLQKLHKGPINFIDNLADLSDSEILTQVHVTFKQTLGNNI